VPHELRRSIGYVIQQIGLFPHRSIGQNIATVPDLLGWDPERTAERVHDLTLRVGLEPEMLDRYPSELSGGQQQRVGVARALAADPPVLLMDEPFGAVDPIVRSRLQDELLELQAELHKTIVFVTHDIDEAIKLGDRICILNVGGVLEQIGPPDEILRSPANAFVEDFLGGERGLKRLGLMSISDVDLSRGPVVTVGEPGATAAATVASGALGWGVVVDEEGALLGWIDSQDISPNGHIGAAGIRPFLVSVAADTSLRTALDAVVSSRTRVAAVVDDEGRYLGLADVETIAEEITE
jgi:osmoprotectant transport system ATP-binding protein